MSKGRKYIPVFFKTIKVAFMVEVKSQLLKVLIEVLSALLFQTVAERKSSYIIINLF